VTGATGQVGTAMRLVYPDATFTTRAELDLSRIESIGDRIRALEPSAVINCAAWTAVDAAETHRDEALAVNGTAVGALAEVCALLDVPFVTYSTDYVFDGTSIEPYVESDVTNPINVYGSTKLAGEEMALRAHARTLVIRASWILSGTHDNFVSAILRRALGAGVEEVEVVDDQRGRPTLAADLARATREVVDRGVTGILHIANPETTTWYVLAREIVGLAGLDPRVVTPCSSTEFPTIARRPSSSILGTERAEAPILPSWHEGLGALVDAQLRRITG